ncbi:MAG TPA: CDP-alcohol phosphatidyltransferase family protein [Micromonosporaceae bacterium]
MARRGSRARRTTPLPNWDQYATSWTALHGGIDPRRARRSVERWLRFGYVIARLCARIHIKPGAVTALGLMACLLVPVFAGRSTGGTLLAAALVAFAAVTDTVDGALAVLTGHATRLGYVYDSVVDRIGEACWLLGMWRIGVHGWVVVLAGSLSWLHEYARSRANAAGMTEIGAATLGERPTRVIVSVFGFALAGLLGLGSPDLPAGVVAFAALAWILLGLIGFLQLFAGIHRALAGRAWQPARRPESVRVDAEPMVTIPPVVTPASATIYTSQFAHGRHLAVDED